MILFISDLHLSADRPDTTRTLTEFLSGPARTAEALYILGDLFEAWVGDDLLDSPLGDEYRGVTDALRELTDSGVPVAIMHGNRDFLLGQHFARASGCTLLTDPHPLDLYGTPSLLSHGDLLCTDDTAYQQFRAQVRDPAWQQAMLQQPLQQRLQMAAQYRADSRQHNQEKAEEIMDVNQEAVEDLMRRHRVRRLIHGHTHRPNQHRFMLDGEPVERLVLDAWYEGGSYLRCRAEGCESVAL